MNNASAAEWPKWKQATKHQPPSFSISGVSGSSKVSFCATLDSPLLSGKQLIDGNEYRRNSLLGKMTQQSMSVQSKLLIAALAVSLALPALVTVLLHSNVVCIVRQALQQLLSVWDGENVVLASRTFVLGALLLLLGSGLLTAHKSLELLLFASRKPRTRLEPPATKAKTEETIVSGRLAKDGDHRERAAPEAEDDFLPQVPPAVRVDASNDDLQSAPLLLSTSLMQQVAHRVLPRKLWDYQWRRLYSLSRDGDSWATVVAALTSSSSKTGPMTLWVIRARRNAALLGALADAPWKAQDGPVQFRGGSGARLFRVVRPAGSEDKEEPQVECFPWTGANRYCQLLDGERRRIAFGAGTSLDSHTTKGGFGLTLERDFLEGTTASCATFDNPPLCQESRFDVVDVEVYGFFMW